MQVNYLLKTLHLVLKNPSIKDMGIKKIPSKLFTCSRATTEKQVRYVQIQQ